MRANAPLMPSLRRALARTGALGHDDDEPDRHQDRARRRAERGIAGSAETPWRWSSPRSGNSRPSAESARHRRRRRARTPTRRPRPRPAADSGTTTRTNAATGGAPSVAAASRQARIDLRDDRVDRQDHEGQENVGRADDQRSLGEDHADRLVGQMQEQQRSLTDAMRAQEDRPGEGLGDDAGRERQEQRGEKQAAQRAPGKREPERRGVADDERDRGGDEAEAQRIPDQRAAVGSPRMRA